jgi:hypothetical protein
MDTKSVSMKVDSIRKDANGNTTVEIELLEKEVSNDTPEIGIYTRLAEIYRESRRWKEATAMLERAVDKLKGL